MASDACSAARPPAAIAAEPGVLHLSRNDAGRAAEFAREALVLYERAQVGPSPLSSSLDRQGPAALQRGQPGAALEALDALLASWREAKPGSDGLAEVLFWRARALRQLGLLAEARADEAAARAPLARSPAPALRGLTER
jgi:hypothetical protein